MKKKKEFSKKLELNKESITNLNDVKGGAGKTILTICKSCKPGACCEPDTKVTRQDLSCISCTGDLCNTCIC